MPPEPTVYDRYLRSCTVLATGALLALACFNLSVDPYRAYRLVDPEALRPVKLEAANRVGKAEMLRHAAFEVVLLGSSRTAVGIDPENPTWGSDRVANLGLAGPTVFEMAEVFRYAASFGSVKRAVFFADFIMFKDALATEGDYEQSRLNPERSALDYHFDNLLSLRATRHSLRVIHGHLHGTDRVVGDTGLIRHVHPERIPTETRFDRVLRSSLLYNYRGVYAPDSVARLESMVELARARGIELTLVIPPIHGLQLEAIHHLGLWEDFEQWKRDLLAVTERDRERHPGAEPVRLWDFAGYTTYSTEPVPLGPADTSMTWWIDSSHFVTALGDLVVERIRHDGTSAADDPGAPGLVLTQQSVGARELELRRDRERYVLEHPQEMAFFERVARRVAEYRKNRLRRLGRP